MRSSDTQGGILCGEREGLWPQGFKGLFENRVELGKESDTTERLNWTELCVSRLPWWLSGKASTCQAGDAGSVPALGRSPEVGNGNPLQYACLGHSMDRGAWRATVHGLQWVGQLSDWTRMHCVSVSADLRKYKAERLSNWPRFSPL